MCGITGFYGSGDAASIENMTAALWHRGPDDGHVYMDGPVALGHRRLSILDVQHGLQPMLDAATGAVLVYNGEVYNHIELRLELEKLGHRFHTSHSDTETVLRAFLQWDVDCFLRFNGMFACAIYEPRKKRLTLARDRFGEKPLFYARNGPYFAFASEIGALRLWPGFDKSFDHANVQRFFSWNYLPGSRCANRHCHGLPPGSWLRFDLETSATTLKSYWQFALRPDESLREEEELARELRRLLVQAVKRRLLSDVPLGIFLSGGLDSSAVLAAAVEAAGPECLRTFTIGFREKSFDESAKAQKVARYLGVRNDMRLLTEEKLRESLPHILSRMSEPFGDASLIPTFHLSSFAREHVKVALSGDGGDELLGGYDPLAAVAPAGFYRKVVPAWLHGLARKLVGRLPASDRNMSLQFKLARALRGLSWPASMQLPVWMSGLEPDEIRKFFDDPLNPEELFADACRLYNENASLNELQQAFMFFTCLYLPDDILVKSDRASMMVSLETRAVFLDNDLAYFCSRLPMRFKYRHGQRKYLLKKALSGWLPPEILRQPKKGFGIPLNAWLRSLPVPTGDIPGLKPGVLRHCQALHQKRHGDFRYFLWDAQAFSHLPQMAAN